MSNSHESSGGSSLKFNTIKLCSVKNLDESNWIEYEYSMRFYLTYRKLWYLLDGGVKLENGIPIATDRRQEDVNELCAILMSSIHEDNISLIVQYTDPSKIWEALKHSHMNTSSGTKFYHLRVLMNTSYVDGEDMNQHLMLISKTATCLRKLCKNGLLSVDDIENAAVISSLPEKFSAVTTHFEQQATIDNKALTDAIRSSVVTNKNRVNTLSSTANAVRASSSSTSQSSSSKNTTKKTPVCDHCKGVHKTENCLRKKNDDLAEQMSVMMKKIEAMGKAKVARPVVDTDSDETSDYSDSMARSATVNLTVEHGSHLRWNIDSGTTNSLVPPTVNVQSPVSSALTLRTANNAKITATGKGMVSVTGLPDVVAHQVEGLAEPLLSVSDVTDNNHGVLFLRDQVLFIDQPMIAKDFVTKSNMVVSKGTRLNRSYYLENTEVSFRASQTSKASLLTWHLRLGHLSLRNLLDLRRRNEIDVTGNDVESVIKCEDCVRGRFNRLNMKSRELHRVSRKLDSVHSDLCQLPVQSRTGARYIMTFLDEYTNYGVIYFLKLKSQALSCFKHYVRWAERQTKISLRKIRTDNGGEYTSQDWQAFCDENGISHSMGPSHSPQMHGKAERYNRTILDRILPTLLHSNLPVRFWEDSVRHSLIGLNSSPSRTNPGSATPHTMWSDTPASYHRLRTFGCRCWRMITGPTQGGKLSPKSSESLLMYTLPEGDGWMVWDLGLSRMVKSHDVIFFEDEFPGLKLKMNRTKHDWSTWTVTNTPSTTHHPSRMEDQSILTEEIMLTPRLTMRERRLSASIHNIGDLQESLSPTSVPIPSNEQSVSSSSTPTSPSPQPSPDPSPQPPTPSPPPAPRRGTRQRRTVVRYGFPNTNLVVQDSFPNIHAYLTQQDPQSYKEAMSSESKHEWVKAMVKEMESLIDKDVFELVPLPKGKRAIGCRWHYRTKLNTDKTIDKLKARLVAKGFLQKHGVDFDETYAPSTKHETIRMVLTHMVLLGWESKQLDVMTAFLNSLLQHEVYLKQPEGFIHPDHPDWVWRVKASLYGLRQAPREWHLTLTKDLKSFGMNQSTADPVLFTYHADDRLKGVVVVHVDDFLVTGEKEFIALIDEKLGGKYKMSKTGPLDTYLSIKITRSDKGEVYLSQEHYIEDIIDNFLSSDAKTAHTPCNAFFSELVKDLSSEQTDQPYAELLGMMQWVANGTRPDIQFAVNRLSQFLSRPTELHWNAAIHVLRYLKTTKHLKLRLGNSSMPLLGYSDADWASTTEDRRSTTGWIFQYGGGAVSWKSRRQPTVALSTTEGEYMAMSDAAKEAMWLRRLADDLGCKEGVVKMFFDNQGAGALSINEGIHKRTKHIDVRHHFIRDCIQSKKISIEYIPTAEMLADVFTKPLGRLKHQQAVQALGLV